MIESLSPDMKHFIQAQGSAGKYPTEADVVVQALVLRREDEGNCERVREHIRQRLRSLDERNYIELNDDEELARFFEEFKQEVRDKYVQKQTWSGQQ
jgi:Arc/MetJ-type ribon-helix-helix transcriptional regulator